MGACGGRDVVPGGWGGGAEGPALPPPLACSAKPGTRPSLIVLRLATDHMTQWLVPARCPLGTGHGVSRMSAGLLPEGWQQPVGAEEAGSLRGLCPRMFWGPGFSPAHCFH